MGSLYVSQELRVDGYAGFGGVGDALYAAKATGDALVTGDLSVGGDLDVTGNITGTVVVTHPLPMGCLEGCAASNAADPDNDITITKGRRRDSTNATNITLAAALTKQMDYKFAAGTNAGGADLGMQIDTALIGTPTDNRAYFTTKAAHGITDQSTVRVVNCSDEAHFNCTGVATVTSATAFWVPISAHADVASVNVTEGVVIACSTGAIATYPGATYYMYLGLNGSTVDAFFSISATGATPPTGYTYFRMIAAFRTDSDGHILPGTWSEGNQRFEPKTRVVVRASAVTGADTVLTITAAAPPNSYIYMSAHYNAAGAINTYWWVASTSITDVAASATNCDMATETAALQAQSLPPIKLDASSQFLARCNANNATFGLRMTQWWLPLGAFDYP